MGYMLIFLVGALLGVLMGGALCVRYLRREVADDIGPKLKRVQLQLDNIETELNLVIATRHAELSTCPRQRERQPPTLTRSIKAHGRLTERLHVAPRILEPFREGHPRSGPAGS
jgi:hypothetical protein